MGDQLREAFRVNEAGGRARPTTGLVLDGAMGTALLARGAVAERGLEALTETHPAWVLDTHGAYLDAGARAILTHTFGANPFRLRAWAGPDACGRLNHAAVGLARRAVADRGPGEASVVGCMGPTGLSPGELHAAGPAAIERAFRTQADALVAAGVDGLLVETFSSAFELRCALRAVAAYPVLCAVSVVPGVAEACPAELLTSALAWGAEVVGLNCGADVRAFEQACGALDGLAAPRFARPSAGLPDLAQGDGGYPTGPAAFGALAARLYGLGFVAVGGCCGTTPAHIAAVKEAADRFGGVAGVSGVAAHAHPKPGAGADIPG